RINPSRVALHHGIAIRRARPRHCTTPKWLATVNVILAAVAGGAGLSSGEVLPVCEQRHNFCRLKRLSPIPRTCRPAVACIALRHRLCAGQPRTDGAPGSLKM